MSKSIVIVDHRLESLVYGRNFSGSQWVLAENEREIFDLMRMGPVRKALLHQKFKINREKGKSVSTSFPPIVLVFDKPGTAPSLSALFPLLPRLDMIVSKKEVEDSIDEIVASIPFFSSWSNKWPDYYPKEMGDIYRIYQKLKFSRAELSPHQWKIFRHWAEVGELNEVARIVGRHPRTIRNNLREISDSLDLEDICQLLRNSTAACLRLVDSIDPWQKEQ